MIVKVVKTKNGGNQVGIDEFAYRKGLPLDHFPYHEYNKNPVYDQETNLFLSAGAVQEAISK